MMYLGDRQHLSDRRRNKRSKTLRQTDQVTQKSTKIYMASQSRTRQSTSVDAEPPQLRVLSISRFVHLTEMKHTGQTQSIFFQKDTDSSSLLATLNLNHQPSKMTLTWEKRASLVSTLWVSSSFKNCTRITRVYNRLPLNEELGRPSVFVFVS